MFIVYSYDYYIIHNTLLLYIINIFSHDKCLFRVFLSVIIFVFLLIALKFVPKMGIYQCSRSALVNAVNFAFHLIFLARAYVSGLLYNDTVFVSLSNRIDSIVISTHYIPLSADAAVRCRLSICPSFNGYPCVVFILLKTDFYAKFVCIKRANSTICCCFSPLGNIKRISKGHNVVPHRPYLVILWFSYVLYGLFLGHRWIG